RFENASDGAETIVGREKVADKDVGIDDDTKQHRLLRVPHSALLEKSVNGISYDFIRDLICLLFGKILILCSHPRAERLRALEPLPPTFELLQFSQPLELLHRYDGNAWPPMVLDDHRLTIIDDLLGHCPEID